MFAYEAVKQLEALRTASSERGHKEAVAILLAYLRSTGSGDVADAWEAAHERQGVWYA